MTNTSQTPSLGQPIVGSVSPLLAAIRRSRLMRRMAVACASVVGGCQTGGCVFLASLLYIAWLNPARVDAVMLFATLASAALLAASLFSLAYWFCDTRG